MKKRISLSDIARATGFAVPTVSMALRNVGTINPATQQKIQEAARRLGYHPNPLLAALASKHFKAERRIGTPIAYIHGQMATNGTDPFHEGMVAAGQALARRLGYRLEPFNVANFKDGAQATRILFARGISGIILSQHLDMTMLPGMDWSRFSVVGWGDTLVDTPTSARIDCVVVDHFRVVLDAWDETWSRGYRRIGFVLFDRSTPTFDDRLRWGAVQACLDQVTPRLRVPPLIYKVEVGGVGDSKILANWVRRYRPDAVIGFNLFIQWLLKKEKFQVPKDLGYASLHKDSANPFYQVEEGSDSGMKHVKLETLLAAIELLDQQIRHHQLGLARLPRILMIRSEWIEGDTLPQKSKVA